MSGHGRPVSEFCVDEWMCEFVSVVDMTTCLNELDTHLQGKYHLIDSVFWSCHGLESKIGTSGITPEKQELHTFSNC